MTHKIRIVLPAEKAQPPSINTDYFSDWLVEEEKAGKCSQVIHELNNKCKRGRKVR